MELEKQLQDKKQAKIRDNQSLTREVITQFIEIKYKPIEEKLTHKDIKTLQALDKELADFKAVLQKNELQGSEEIKTEEIEAFCYKMKPKAELIVREVIEEIQLAALKAAETARKVAEAEIQRIEQLKI